MFYVIVFSWNNSPCLFTIHGPSLSVHQPFMSLGRQVTKKQRQPYSVWTGQFWNGQDCLFVWYTRTLATQSLSFSVQCQSTAAFQCTQTDSEEESVMTDGLPVGCVLPFDTLDTPPPPHAVVVTSLFRPLPHHVSINHRHSVHRQLERNFVIDKLQW